MTTISGQRFRIEDGNENVCGACLKSGTLICCEHCPASFHPECAGYPNIDAVPEGDWYCFLCSRKLKKPFLISGIYRGGEGDKVMVMTDDHGEIFAEGIVRHRDGDRLTIQIGSRTEAVTDGDDRLWKGTLNATAWTQTPDGEFRPNSRAYEIDYQQMKVSSLGKASDERSYLSFLKQKKSNPREKHFLDLLDHFWRVEIKSDGIKWPSFGDLVPLADLWDEVQKFGGYRKVCEDARWNEIGDVICSQHDVPHYPFILKHSFQTVLLDVESFGGVEAMEMLKTFKPAPDDQPSSEASCPPNKRRKREKSKKPKGLPSAEAWMRERTIQSDVLTHRSWPQVFSASRAVQEYRTAIGIVALTDLAKGLRVGEDVDVRLCKDNTLGPWRAGRILTIATAGAFEGYRRFRIRFLKSKDRSHPCPSEEWVTLLARPSAWGSTLSKPSVLIRSPVRPYFPPTKSQSLYGRRVEAWLYEGWWPATVLEMHSDRAVLQGDVIPLGEGLRWVSPLYCIRPVHQGENEGYGMIEPLKMDEAIYPKEMERKLNVTVDKSVDGHLILSFKRLDQKPKM